MKIGMVVTSRNNYDFMEKYWIENINYLNIVTLNIDEDSSPEEKEKGKKMCSKHNIYYLDREERGMQNNMSTACKFFRERDVNFVIWWQHDCWPADKKQFFETLNTLLQTNKLDKFGLIGFNVLATDVVRNYEKQFPMLMNGEKPIGILARSPLELYKYYSGVGSKKVKALPNNPNFHKIFAIESPEWTAVAFNVNSYKNIEPTGKYQFFHAWDDIAFQFLKKNIYNVVVPNLYVVHRPDLKPECGLPILSVSRAKKGDETFHGKWGHLKVWEKRWMWDWEERKTFEKVKKQYKNTLLWDFYHHNVYEKGPLKVFD